MIKDQIIKGNLADFQAEFNYRELNEDNAFERFVNYLLLSRINSKIFEDNDYIEKISIDDGQNFGIDGIALLVNNTFVFEEETIDEYKKYSEQFPNLHLNLIFIQSKTTPGFDTGELLKFCTAVNNFFEIENVQNYSAPDIKRMWKLKNILVAYDFLKCVDKNSSPILTLYYVTTGKYTDDKILSKIISDQETFFKESFPYFADVKINLIDATQLKKYYQEINNNVDQMVLYKERVDLGNIQNVGKAFLGYMPALEYLKLIVDDEDNFRQNLFYENVRDFKGIDNKVNSEIAKTIKDISYNDKFILLNNGITIVTKKVDTNFQGGAVRIINYQIVNGCQTSNVLYLCRNIIRDNQATLMIPVKLIECQDNEITNAITKATNNQNPVPEEAFIALEEFPKELQRFFDSSPDNAPNRIYYERRSREYESHKPKINQMQIFHLHKLIRAICAMFIDIPHLNYRFPGELYKQTKNSRFGESQKMFTLGQSPYPYYTSCYTWYIIEKLFAEHKLNSQYKQIKFHLMLAIRIKVAGKNVCRFDNIKDIETYCKKILMFLYDEKGSEPVIINLFEQIKNSIDYLNMPMDKITKSKEFTDYIINNVH